MKKLYSLITETKTKSFEYEPSFFRLAKEEDRQAFEKLLDKPGLLVFDELNNQLRELMKIKNPTMKFDETNRTLMEHFVQNHMGATIHMNYGVWVYYPWSQKLVHTLDEEEYIELRTNRNTYKITPEERIELSKKKVGVIGLSVGQSVALTLAMERSIGELRIGDFDIIEMTNLNRIRTPNSNIEILKTIVVAREIAEIDPFLKVTCFHDGLHEENMDDFLQGNGKLDLLIEECDGLYVKILARQRAKELKIPVLMDTSDRGMIDIERFDLEPERSILHGLIDHLDLDKVKEAKTNEEKVPYIIPMIGIDTMSKRMKASMVEVEQTITTWPQLASDVVSGGAIAAKISRKILLNEHSESGRFFTDYIDKLTKVENIITPENIPTITVEQMKESASLYLQNSAAKNCKGLSDDDVKELVTLACLAPSGGNMQPWKWLYHENQLFLFHDKNKSVSLLDFKDTGSFIAFGACLENIKLTTDKMGLSIQVSFLPLAEDSSLIFVINFVEKATLINDGVNHELYNAIGIRCTNRNLTERTLLEDKLLEKLRNETTSFANINSHFFTDEEDIQFLGEQIAKCDRIRIMNDWGHNDFFFGEMRWNNAEAESTKDGIDIETVDLDASDIAGMHVTKDFSTIDLLKQWRGGGAFEKMSKKSVLTSSAIGMITLNKFNSLNYFECGQALQKIWLKANANGISFQPVTPITFLLARVTFGDDDYLTQREKDELKEIKQDLEKRFKLFEKEIPAFFFKLSKADAPKKRSLRKNLDEVLTIDRQ